MKMEYGSDLPPDGAGSGIDPSAPVARTRYFDERTTDSEFDFVRLIRILHCRRKLIFTIATFGVLSAALIGLLIAPKYTATARIEVQPQQAIDGRAEAPMPADQLLTEIDTHVAKLASRDHLRRVLDSLSDTPQSGAALDAVAHESLTAGNAGMNRAVNSTTSEDTALSFAELGRRLKIWLGALAGRRPDQELDALQRRLRVLQERSSRIISVSFTAKSPARAAAVANRVVQLYVSDLAGQGRAQANQELAALDERAVRLKSELDKATEVVGTLLSSPPGAAGASTAKEQEARLHALEREAASTGQAYAGVLQREEQIRDRQEAVVPGVRIVSRASPPDRPSSVNPILFIFPALVVSLIGASLLAIILERLDRSLRSQRDVTDALGLPCIGLIPLLPRCYVDRPFHYLQNEPFTPYAESIRSALAALHLAQPHRKPTTILISSSVQGEGKTTVAASLAVYAAGLGRRVILVDFDSRHPSVMRILRGRPQTPDLKDRSLDETIQHLADLHLDYLAVPHGNADPLTPFMNERMPRFLRRLRESYDYVFIDGPPLLGITETALLAAMVDSVILVIKWSGTRRDVVQNAGNVLRNALPSNGGHVVCASALVTQADLRRHADYRYGDVGEAYAKYQNDYFIPIEFRNAVKDSSYAGGDEACDAGMERECAP